MVYHDYMKNFINWLKFLTCKHVQTTSASCPFTGNTYTDCLRCGARQTTKTML